MSDFPPLKDEDWPAEIAELRSGFAGRLNVYRVMAHDPSLLRAWAPLRQYVVLDNALGPQFSEVVILRTGFRAGAAYEWVHHVSRARAVGMDDARIASIGGPLEAMSEADALLSRAVDELADTKALSPDTQAGLVDMVGKDGLFDVIATVGFYTTLAFIVKSFETPVDVDVARELEEQPLSPGASIAGR